MPDRPVDPVFTVEDSGSSPVDPYNPAALKMAEDLTKATSNYHALMKDTDLAAKVIEIVQGAKRVMRASGIYTRARLNHNLFYARDVLSTWEENLKTDGENGDSISLAVNILKNAVEHILAMINSTRPAMDPVAKNSDADTNNIVRVAKAVVDSRLHDQREINTVNMAVKHCPVLASSFIHSYWDPFVGGSLSGPAPAGHPSIMRQTPGGVPVAQFFKGDVKFEVLSLLDVFFDLSAQSWDTDVDECVIRVYRNRYDLMARYPQVASALENAPPRATSIRHEYLPSPTSAATSAVQTPSQQARIEVWIYYHKRTLAVPNGRMLTILPGGTVLDDGPMPDGFEWPVHRLCPDTVIGSAHGYAQVTSSGGLQEGLNIGASAVMTNLAAFARRVIVAQKGMEIEPSDLTGDLKLLEVEFTAAGKPPVEALDLMGDPGKTLDILNWMVGQIEQDTGANSIVRGDPKGVTAGVAINLYQSMAMQFSSALEGERTKALEWMANTIISSYRAHPDIEREVQVIGKTKRPMLRSFYGRDLHPIQRFVCDPGNPSSRTIAGRYQMAQMLKQDGVPTDPAKLVKLVQTGQWDDDTGGMSTQEDLIKAENELLAEGTLCPVMPGDDPVMHVRGHLPVGYNPEVRFDQAKLRALSEHLQMHFNQMVEGDPFVKLAAGLLPMGPFPKPGEMPVHGDAPPPPGGSGGMPAGVPSPGGGQPPKSPAGGHPPGPSDAGDGPLVPKPPPVPRLDK